MELLFFAVLVAAGAILAGFPRATRLPVGCLMVLAGVAVFAIRLQSEVAAFPREGNLLAGLAALAVGIVLLMPGSGAGRLGSLARRALLAAAPVVLFFALYSTLAEVEEVVVLRTPDAAGEVADLRLWIVDHEGAAWVTMPRWKAETYDLGGEARLELLRQGEAHCVVADRFEDYEQVDAVFRRRTEKYAVQRLAQALGIYGDRVGENTVTLRLASCPAS